MKNNSQQKVKKDNSDSSNENYLETRNKTGEGNEFEPMPVFVDNQLTADIILK